MSDTLTSNSTEPRLPNFQLDDVPYTLDRDAIEFLKSQTGIQDEEELKQHVLAVRKKAWDVSLIC